MCGVLCCVAGQITHSTSSSSSSRLHHSSTSFSISASSKPPIPPPKNPLKIWIKSPKASLQASRRRSTPSSRVLRVWTEISDTTGKNRARVGRISFLEVSGPHYLSFMILEVVILMWWNKFQFYARMAWLFRNFWLHV